MRRPEVRRSFREFVADKVNESLGGHGGPIRYVSIGSGLLLMDFEILCALEMRGLTIESITLADTSYAYARGVVGDARIDALDGNAYDRSGFEAYYKPLVGSRWQSMWDNALTPEHVAAALAQLARFFPSAQVKVFPTVEHLRQACLALPDEYARNDVLVHCDAAGIDRDASRAVACACLAVDRFAFHLQNHGSHADAFSSACEPWPSPCKFDALTREQMEYLNALLEERSSAECWRCSEAMDHDDDEEDQGTGAGEAGRGRRHIVDEPDARCRRFDADVVEERRKLVARLLKRSKGFDCQAGAVTTAAETPQPQQAKELMSGSSPVTAFDQARATTAAAAVEAAVAHAFFKAAWLGTHRNAARAVWRERRRSRVAGPCEVCG
jgi:hypothetical protein